MLLIYAKRGFKDFQTAAIFAKGIGEKRIVLTFDLDFGEIAATAGVPHTSVILFRLGNTRASYVIERLAVVLDQAETHWRVEHLCWWSKADSVSASCRSEAADSRWRPALLLAAPHRSDVVAQGQQVCHRRVAGDFATGGNDIVRPRLAVTLGNGPGD